MATGIIRLDQLPETKRIKSRGPTEREMRDMQRQHEQAVEELNRQIPLASSKVRNFVFTR